MPVIVCLFLLYIFFIFQLFNGFTVFFIMNINLGCLINPCKYSEPLKKLKLPRNKFKNYVLSHYTHTHELGNSIILALLTG